MKQLKPITTFADPQMALLPDSSWRMYANVDNRLLIDDQVRDCFVVVPTELFTLMKDVLGFDVHDRVNLHLDIDGAYATFSVNNLDDLDYGLWYYTTATLPMFLRSRITLEEP